MTEEPQKAQDPRPQFGQVAHLKCNLCGERSTALDPLQANAWIKAHLEAMHPGKAAELAAIDRTVGQLNASRDRLIQKFSQKLNSLFTSEMGRIVTPPPSHIIKPS